MTSGDRPDRLLRKINSRSVTILAMIIVIMAGCIMVFVGIRDEGYIDVRSAFVNGSLKTGFVGIVVMIIAVVPLIVAIRFHPVPSPGSERSIYIKLRDGTEIRLQGVQSMRETLVKLKEVFGAEIAGIGADPDALDDQRSARSAE